MAGNGVSLSEATPGQIANELGRRGAIGWIAFEQAGKIHTTGIAGVENPTPRGKLSEVTKKVISALQAMPEGI